ncbi:peptidyl-prolyl cis-trans isomerase B-like [Ptychodera flava]|uniref:peptidyl-prolyl cis-trans isomerase B-like n=1 Tax=Ptychodera flava TaxID=63121 RepID=UPI00396A0282
MAVVFRKLLLGFNLVSVALIFNGVVASEELKELTVTHKVFFDMKINNKDAGRIVIGLFGDIVPKTVENFVRLAASKRKKRSYSGSFIHRIMKGTGIIGGDFINDDGSGVYSIHGKYFADENFKIKHSSPGMVSMASHGEHKNGCQFMISSAETPWLDNRTVVFGKVLKGMDIVYRINDILPTALGRPMVDVKIEKSGRINIKKPFVIKMYDDEDEDDINNKKDDADKKKNATDNKVPDKEL